MESVDSISRDGLDIIMKLIFLVSSHATLIAGYMYDDDPLPVLGHNLPSIIAALGGPAEPLC